jgi:hypothetical protein
MLSRWERLPERPGREAGLRYSAGRAQRGCGRSVRWDLAITGAKRRRTDAIEGLPAFKAAGPRHRASSLVSADFFSETEEMK